MTRRNALAFATAALSPLGRGPARAAASSSPAGKAFTTATENAAALIVKQVENGTLAGAAIEVMKGDSVYQQAFGTATLDSMFLLGSITKTFTATAVMVLADQGRLSLADKVMKHLPEFNEDERKEVTIQHLLAHTSGLPDQLPDNNAMRARHAPLGDFVTGTVRTPLLFAPGTQYHYQSMGIMLAAEIVQRVSGSPLPAFLDKEVFGPLGMKRTVLGLGAHTMPEMMRMQTEHAAPEAGGGDPNARNWDWNSDYWRHLAAPWGGAHSTAADLTLFLRSFMHPAKGGALRPETARLMIQNHTPGLEASRGIGFMVGPEGFAKACSPRAFGHSGSTGTLAWADPETDMSFVLLTTLPANVSRSVVLHPVSDLVAGS